MITEIDSLIYQAEEEYLNQKDLGVFKTQVLYLAERLQTYEQIRDQEADIFQQMINQMINNFPDEPEAKVERALKHWLMILRYSAMAMISNDPQYLEQRILEWLPEQIAAHQTQEIERSCFNYLRKILKRELGDEKFALLQPYLEQSQNVFLIQEKTLEPA